MIFQIFGFIWGMIITIIIKSLGGEPFACWQFWVGLLLPLIGAFIVLLMDKK